MEKIMAEEDKNSSDFVESSGKNQLTVIDQIIETEFCSSEAVGIKKDEPSVYINVCWHNARASFLSNIYHTLTTAFQTLGTYSTADHLNGVAGRGLRTAFIGTQEELPTRDSEITGLAPFVVHQINTHGAIRFYPHFFQLNSSSAQQAVDFCLIMHRIAELSLCPGVHSVETGGQTEKDAQIISPTLPEIKAYLGMPEDIIKPPTNLQKEIFGEARRRIPGTRKPQLAKNSIRLLNEVAAICQKAMNEFEQATGRTYTPIESHQMEKAGMVIVAMGQRFARLLKHLPEINENLDGGVGLLHPVLIQPFPGSVVAAELKGKNNVVIISGHLDAESDPVYGELRRGFDRAVANGFYRNQSRPDLPYPDYPAYGKAEDEPSLFFGSVAASNFDLEELIENLKSIKKGDNKSLYFTVPPAAGTITTLPSKKTAAQVSPLKLPQILREEAEGEEAAAKISSKENLRQLLTFFLTGKIQDEALQPISGKKLIPVQFYNWLKETEARENFPVCLVEDDPQRIAVPLKEIFKQLNGDTTNNGEVPDNYGDILQQLELRIESQLNGKRNGRLQKLWNVSAESILSEFKEGDKNREEVEKSLQAAKQKLSVDGEILVLDERTPTRLINAALGKIWAEKSHDFGRELDRLIYQLTDFLKADMLKSQKSREPEELKKSMGTSFKEDLDFETFSHLLDESFTADTLPDTRQQRINDILPKLKSLWPLYSVMINDEVNSREIQMPLQFYRKVTSLAAAYGQVQAQLRVIIEFFRAVHIARLEVENKYKEDRHDAYFRNFDLAYLTDEDIALMPPLLLHIDRKDFDDVSQSTLLELLEMDLPVKILLIVDDVIDYHSSQRDPIGTAHWSTKFASLAIAFNDVFMFQSTISDVKNLEEGMMKGLKYDGPALLCVYNNPGDEFPGIIPSIIARAARESRTFPSFTFDPSNGENLASRFDISANPVPENDWPLYPITYKNTRGKEQSLELPFTYVDLLAADSRFGNQFIYLSRERWHENLLPLHHFLGLSREDAKFKLPYILMTDEEGTLYRVVPSAAVVESAFNCAANWHILQELGGINNSYALSILEQAKSQFEEEKQKEIEEVEKKKEDEFEKSKGKISQEVVSNILSRLISGDLERRGAEAAAVSVPVEPVAGETPAVEAGETVKEEAAEETKEEAETKAVIEEPYIDSPLCTSCNDCININSRMFAYNEDKQAYIKDPTAGTFKELVMAAEKCPARIIHPGLPKNPNEKGLDKLIKRAEPFNQI